MLVPSDIIMNGSSSSSLNGVVGGGGGLLSGGDGGVAGGNKGHLVYQVNKFCNERVSFRRSNVCKNIRDVVKIVQDVLKEVEVQEPRFISSLSEGCNSHFEGLTVHSAHEFEVVLYLNQMGVFNFVDDGSLPGCSVLKLSDGRKRSMSLWVEFITASGYLSARKIRSRFQTLVAAACDKTAYRDLVKVLPDSSEVRLRIRERYIVQVTPGMCKY